MTEPLPRRAYATMGLRCRDLAVEIVALNDVDQRSWKQSAWITVLDQENSYYSPQVPQDHRIDFGGTLFADVDTWAAGGAEHGCHTAGCIAGWATMLNNEPVLVQLADNGQPTSSDPVVLHDGKLVEVADRAVELLCLGEDSHIAVPNPNCTECDPGECEHLSGDLFSADNNRETVVRLLAAAYEVSIEEFERLVAARVEELSDDLKRHEQLLEFVLDEAADAPTA